MSWNLSHVPHSFRTFLHHSGPLPGDTAERTSSVGTVRAVDRMVLDRLGRALAGVPVCLRLWDGRTAVTVNAPAVATVTIRDRRALVALVLQPEVGFGEAYRDGRLAIEGDLVALVDAVDRRTDWRALHRPRGLARARLGGGVARAKDNVRRHYDVGNDFYRLWLDRDMVYTCAYFPTPAADLETAQRAKLDYVCRKVQLKPGEIVYEAGAGWGALAIHAARHYGATVRAWNLSRAQVRYARDRARALGVADRVDFVQGDYRDIEGRCDVFLSIGMLEHVGPSHYAALGRVMDRVLDPDDGRGLLHFIGRNSGAPFSRWVQRRVFPGAYAPTLAEAIEGALEPYQFSIVDVENLRQHYALTLAHWLARFDAASDRVRAMFDERFLRTWRLYLAGSQASFASGSLQLFQVAFARPLHATPLTRGWLYR